MPVAICADSSEGTFTTLRSRWATSGRPVRVGRANRASAATTSRKSRTRPRAAWRRAWRGASSFPSPLEQRVGVLLEVIRQRAHGHRRLRQLLDQAAEVVVLARAAAED